MIEKSQPTILYMHIPKAGGSSLSKWLYMHLKDGDWGNHPWFGAGIMWYPSGYVTKPPQKEIDKAHFLLRNAKVNAVFGHFNYGIHKYLNSSFTYFVILRNPIERILSMYFFQRYIEETRGSLNGVRLPKNMNIRQFVETPPYPEVDNGQTRRIAGLADDFLTCTPETLEIAKQNLKQNFSIVGTMEEIIGTTELMIKKFSFERDLVGPITKWKININPSKPCVDSIDLATRELIEEKNQLDMRLYKFAKEILQQELERFGVYK